MVDVLVATLVGACFAVMVITAILTGITLYYAKFPILCKQCECVLSANADAPIVIRDKMIRAKKKKATTID